MPATYGLLATALVIAVVAVAYGSAAPQLGVAEFAPSAQQSIESPPTTAADTSANAGSNGRRSTTTTTPATATTAAPGASATAAPTTRVTRSRACTGTPPRQTPDPQSPPCVAAIFDGDNGGATSKGVSGTEIRVVVDSQINAEHVQLLFDYFNLNFEFYGRRLVPVSAAYSTAGPVEQRAAGDDIAALDPFAVLDKGIAIRRPTPWFYLSLARHGVISLTGRDTPFTNRMLFDYAHPYIWGTNPSADEIWSAVAELTCNALAGRLAARAGGGMQTTTRKFGLVVENLEGGTPFDFGHRMLVDRLNACGVNIMVSQMDSVSVSGRAALEAMKGAGVTTVICSCGSGLSPLATAAQSAGYEPEFMLGAMALSFETLESNLQSASIAASARRVFGVYPTPKLLPYQVRPFFTVMSSMKPSFGSDSTTFAPLGGFRDQEATYRQLMVLASGVQGAGPNLTPETFGQALMSTEFPNPGAGQAPYWQPSVGFGPGDHTFHDDVALAWWNPTIPGTSVAATGSGSWCFLGGGSRFQPGQLPTDAAGRFFNPAEPCR